MTIARCDDTIYDRMHNAAPRHVANLAMKTLDNIQDSPADLQIAAVGVLFITLTRRYHLAPETVLNCVDNLMRTARRYDDATFKGIFAYFENEM